MQSPSPWFLCLLLVAGCAAPASGPTSPIEAAGGSAPPASGASAGPGAAPASPDTDFKLTFQANGHPNATGSGSVKLSGDETKLTVSIDCQSLSGPPTQARIVDGARVEIPIQLNGNTASGTWTAADPKPLTAENVKRLKDGFFKVQVATAKNPKYELLVNIVQPIKR